MILKLVILVSAAPGVSYASRYLLADRDGGQGGHCQMDGLVFLSFIPRVARLSLPWRKVLVGMNIHLRILNPRIKLTEALRVYFGTNTLAWLWSYALLMVFILYLKWWGSHRYALYLYTGQWSVYNATKVRCYSCRRWASAVVAPPPYVSVRASMPSVWHHSRE
jgi:hypothetical protein